MSLFRAPAVVRAAKTLDRSVFSQTLSIAAACVRDNGLISRYRKSFEKSKDLLLVDKLNPVAADPDPSLAAEGQKCLLLRPGIQPEGRTTIPFVLQACIVTDITEPATWSKILQEASDIGDIRIVPYETTIGYDLWSYCAEPPFLIS